MKRNINRRIASATSDQSPNGHSPSESAPDAVAVRDETLPQPSGDADREKKIAQLAYEYWQQRGCPDGSPDYDWLRAETAVAEIENSVTRAAVAAV